MTRRRLHLHLQPPFLTITRASRVANIPRIYRSVGLFCVHSPRWPSGLNATLKTASACPVSLCSTFPLGSGTSGFGISLGAAAVETSVCWGASPPDHPHHQQQTQQTFHFQLLRLAHPDATNTEAGAHRVRRATGPAPAAGAFWSLTFFTIVAVTTATVTTAAATTARLRDQAEQDKSSYIGRDP